MGDSPGRFHVFDLSSDSVINSSAEKLRHQVRDLRRLLVIHQGFCRSTPSLLLTLTLSVLLRSTSSSSSSSSLLAESQRVESSYLSERECQREAPERVSRAAMQWEKRTKTAEPQQQQQLYYY